MGYYDSLLTCFKSVDCDGFNRGLFEPVFKHLCELGQVLDDGTLDTTVLREFRQLLVWFIEFVSKCDGGVPVVDLLRVDGDAMVRSDVDADAEFEAVIRGFDAGS